MNSIVLALLLLGLGPCGLAQIEHEPNNRAADATPLASTRTGLPDFLNHHRGADGVVEHGRLEPGDVDYYSFAAQAGDVVMVSLFERGRGAFADPVLGIAGPGDTEPLTIDDDGGPNFLPRLAVPIDRTGVWTIAVTGFGDTEFDGGDHTARFDYDLIAAVAPAVATRAGHAARKPHGHEPPELILVRSGRAVVVTGELAPGGVDRFLIARPLHAVLTASLFDDEAGEFDDSRLVLRDLRGRRVAEDDDSGPGFLSNLAVDAKQPRGATILEVTGFDPNPEDDVPHPEQFRYRLVVSLQNPLLHDSTW